MFYSFLMFFFGVVGLLLVRKHYLLSLLMIEFLVISLFYMIFFFFSFYFFEYYFSIIFLILAVCDGVLGLSMLVYLVRSVGNDYLSSLNLC